MGALWWAVFLLNFLFAAGVMLTYLGRRNRDVVDGNKDASSNATRKALVILPIKGVDYELEENLASLRAQEYGPYDIVAVVDSGADESVPFLKKHGIRYSVSSASCVKCSGKVRAIYSALIEFPDYDYYVVADSDIRVNSGWLKGLLLPLHDPAVGASTTFPVFYPDGGFWSKLKMFWGLVGQSMMESGLTRFVWGGSMAFRRDLLDDAALRSFSESVSDDIAVLKIVEDKGLRVSYVPGSKPEIHSNDNFETFVEWANRQTAFSVYYTNRTFIYGMIYYNATIYLVLSSVIFSIFVSPLFIIFLFPFVYNSINSQRKVPVKTWYFPSLTFILPFIYVWNLISGITRRRVTWRGTTYSLSKDE
ncbi:MAG: glycosyltransferase family 2 protein [Thermoplasmata archaeon]